MVSDPIWWVTKDGDRACWELWQRHYSRYEYKDGRKPKRFCGPGYQIVLRTWEGDAMFVWKKFRSGDGQEGINCGVFRNESSYLSSDLIRQADAIADFVWPGERHYTYVNAAAIKSQNPGYCFIQAGWKRLSVRTKTRGLCILHKLPVKSAKQIQAIQAAQP